MLWRTTEASKHLLAHLKAGVGLQKVNRLLLKSLRPLALRFGFMGDFDKNLYMFIVVIIGDITINVLLM